MEALTLLNTIFNDWKIIVFAFGVGAFYYQAKIAIKKIMSALENTSTTHQAQNIILDNINDKIDNLDKRMSKLEGSIELVAIENHQQSVRLSVIETRQDIDEGINIPSKRRVRRTQ